MNARPQRGGSEAEECLEASPRGSLIRRNTLCVSTPLSFSESGVCDIGVIMAGISSLPRLASAAKARDSFELF